MEDGDPTSSHKPVAKVNIYEQLILTHYTN